MAIPKTVLDSLIPPSEILIEGVSSPEEFVAFGEGFLDQVLCARAYLGVDAAVLDVGCGSGSLARALAAYLSPSGRYTGLEVNAGTVAWLQERYAPLTNFSFHHADVYSAFYNPTGRFTEADYGFPFSDGVFDVVVLKSVFTHMTPQGVRRYLSEIYRVLRRGGRSVITYFLLNDEARRFISAGGCRVPLGFEYQRDPLCRVADPQVPEKVVAHDEVRMRAYNAAAGFSFWEVAYGNWCGRPSAGGLQDVMIATKA